MLENILHRIKNTFFSRNPFSRPRYQPLTRKMIDTIKNDDLVQAVFDDITGQMGDGIQEDYEIVQQMSEGQQMVYSTWWVEAEVNNGGFTQFYFNSSGNFSEMALKGFQLIGAEKYADLMQKANALYLSDRERLETFNDGTVESFNKSYENNPLNDLDDLFYQLYREENLEGKRVKYIRKNIDQFIGGKKR